jgi:D-galactarolactone cycloisomerase
MKITAVDAIHVALPYEHGAPKPERKGVGAWDSQDILFVRVETDAGFVGWGEAFGHASTPATAAALKTIVAPLAIGCDPTEIAKLMEGLLRRTQSMARSGPVRFALSGLDIALWDIAGQVRKEPIWKMLGGVGKDSVPAYASLFRLSAREYVERVSAAAVERGYRMVKLHEHSVENVWAARRAVGKETGLMTDTNCWWESVDKAAEFCAATEGAALTWLEEPLYPADSYDACRQLRERVGVPIAAGENLGNFNDGRWLAEQQAVDVVQPSVAKVGGISEAWKMISFFRQRQMRAVPHTPFLGPALVATIHMIAALPDDVVCEHRFCELGANPLGEAVVSKAGRLPVPQGHGLGISVDLDIVEAFRVG